MKSLLLAALVLLLSACASTPGPVETRPAPPARSAPPTSPTPAPAPVTSPAPATRPVPPPANPGNEPSTPGKGGYYLDDGPGANPPADMASIPDAQPRKEPLHPRANRPYVALGQSFTPLLDASDYKARGIASWYGKRFHGKPTSSGEPYDMYAMTAAHPILPIPSYVRVTNVQNGKSVIVRVNDRGPFKKDRLIDLSYTAAWKLGYTGKGSTEVEVELVRPDDSPPVVAEASGTAPVAVAEVRVAEAPAAVTSVVSAPAPASAVSPTPAPAATTPAAASAPAGIYLQLGAFSTLGNAEGFRDYAQQELKGQRQTLHIVPDGTRYRLQLGPFADVSSARAAIEGVTKALKLTPFIVQR
ncbi:septal ring lytic transglycosylase RlpA family protein [Viridibacterium curvum]|uniref:Endolytic peptidoglycan transglycosylase RlpA n=1 Tax=Viridibacterium curvum TaxID=1101404 RepID=A0ABP9QPJ7_9RHOO